MKDKSHVVASTRRGPLGPISIIFALTMLVTPPAFATPTVPFGVRLTSEMPKTAFAFRDSFAVDSHFGIKNPYMDTYSTLASTLFWGPVRHLRDGDIPLVGTGYPRILRQFCDNGIHHSAGFQPNSTRQQIISTINLYGPECVDYVEPVNEADARANFGKKDPQWERKLIAEQTLLYKTMKSIPAFANITVLGPALSSPRYYAQLGNLEAISDAGNQHDATCDGNPGTTFYRSLDSRLAAFRYSWPTKPIWTTETDYGDIPSIGGHCALPDDVIAKYVARTQAERFNRNQPRVYWNQLEDELWDTFAGDEGLLRSNAAPKPAYIEMKNLMQVVGDAARGRMTRPIAWALVGSRNIHHTLLQKNDGTYELMLWNEVPSWNTITHVRIFVPAQDVTAYLPRGVSTATYYTFNTSYQMVARPVRQSGQGFRIPVGDSISVLEFKPNS